jgi:parvulin-like peptidyl-prolyl isomerase
MQSEQTVEIQNDLFTADPPTLLAEKARTFKLRRWLREPLVHFILIGLGVFIVYSLVRPAPPKPSSNRIVLNQDDLKQLRASWAAQWGRPPSADEMRGLIDERVREEIFYREGLGLGLDQNDEIIKRRLAQKMEFLAEDVSAVHEPTPTELRAWFAKNSARFILPGLVTFHHLYFSPDSRGANAQADASRELERITAGSSAGAADRFMFQDYYADSSPEQVSKVFGTQFSEALLKLKTRSWQGPIQSGLGWHLVRIEGQTPGGVPPFEEVDPAQLKSEWMADQRAESKRQAYDVMKQRYEVVLPSAQ